MRQPGLSADDVHPRILHRGRGRHFHLLGMLATLKAVDPDAAGLTAVELVARAGVGSPLHRHRHEGTFVILLEGLALHAVADGESVLRPGTTVFVPSGLVHGFQMLSAEARLLVVAVADHSAGPQLGRLIRRLGTPVSRPTLPRPEYVDPTRVADVCLQFGVDIVGPPPGPLGDQFVTS